jgi:hypothetical protein
LASEQERFGVVVLPELASHTVLGLGAGPTAFWAGASLLFLAVTSVILVAAAANGWLYLAFSSAAFGLFLCSWGAIVGIGAVVAQFENVERILDAPQAAVREDLAASATRWVSGWRPILCGLLSAGGITACLWLQNHEQPLSDFARAFDRTDGALYLPVFVASFAIGIGHSCIVGALRVAGTIRRHRPRRMYSPVRVRRISVTYLWLALLCSVTYASFLGYVFSMYLSGVHLSPAVNALAAAVGSIVLWVYLYPQWTIHLVLRENRHRLTAEALERVEKISADGADLSLEQWRELMEAVGCVEAMAGLPITGFRWRELAGVVISYVLPMVAFLASQLPRFAELAR